MYNKDVQIFSNRGMLVQVPYPFCTCQPMTLSTDTLINRELYYNLGYMVDGKFKEDMDKKCE